MLIIFNSDAYENITFLGDVALTLLRMMGCSAASSGIIKAEDVSAALQRLKSALDNEDKKSSSIGRNQDEKKPVSLSNRAYTLIEMLEASVKEKCDVHWKDNTHSS